MARELKDKAAKKAKGGSGILGWFSGPDYDGAAELYVQAANQFKMAKEWREAGLCLVECALCANKSGSKNEESTHYAEAANCFKRVSAEEALVQWERAVEVLNNEGHFGRSAKLLKSAAETLEQEGGNVTAARKLYSRAAEFFEMDDYGKSSLSACLLKVAELLAREGSYAEAAGLYEKEGEKSLQNALLQYGAKEHFLRAGILHLVDGDAVTAKIACDRYCAADPKFAVSREGKLLVSLSTAFGDHDEEAFVNALAEYDEVTTLDAWKTEMLVKVKKHLGTPEDDIFAGGAAGGDIDLS